MKKKVDFRNFPQKSRTYAVQKVKLNKARYIKMKVKSQIFRKKPMLYAV